MLAILQRDAWVEAISVDPNNETSFETWKKKMVDNSPTFQYINACSSHWKFR